MENNSYSSTYPCGAKQSQASCFACSSSRLSLLVSTALLAVLIFVVRLISLELLPVLVLLVLVLLLRNKMQSRVFTLM